MMPKYASVLPPRATSSIRSPASMQRREARGDEGAGGTDARKVATAPESRWPQETFSSNIRGGEHGDDLVSAPPPSRFRRFGPSIKCWIMEWVTEFTPVANLRCHSTTALYCLVSSPRIQLHDEHGCWEEAAQSYSTQHTGLNSGCFTVFSWSSFSI
jgi:hypothetical protein